MPDNDMRSDIADAIDKVAAPEPTPEPVVEVKPAAIASDAPQQELPGIGETPKDEKPRNPDGTFAKKEAVEAQPATPTQEKPNEAPKPPQPVLEQKPPETPKIRPPQSISPFTASR